MGALPLSPSSKVSVQKGQTWMAPTTDLLPHHATPGDGEKIYLQ